MEKTYNRKDFFMKLMVLLASVFFISKLIPFKFKKKVLISRTSNIDIPIKKLSSDELKEKISKIDINRSKDIKPEAPPKMEVI